jgi:hypothetical protein
MSARHIWFLALFVGIAMRAFAVSEMLPPTSDAADYHRLAVGLARGDGYVSVLGGPETLRPPGYPAFASMVYRVAGESPRAVASVQIVIDVLTSSMLVWWARRRFHDLAGWVAGALFLGSLGAAAATAMLLSECLATSLLVCACALASEGRRTLITAMGVGVLLGALTLVRPSFTLFPLVVGALFVLRHWPARGFLALAVSYLAVLAPWVARNHEATGRAIVSSNGGMTLYSSWVHTPGQAWGTVTQDATMHQALGMPSVESDRFLRDKTWQWLRAHPGEAASMLPKKLALVISPIDWEVIGRGVKRAWNPFFVVMAMAAGVGAVRSWRRDADFVLFAILAWAMFVALSLVFYGSARMRLPLEPLLIMLASSLVPKAESR